MSPRLLATLAAALGAIAVMAGAFGAHALKEMVPPDRLQTWKTAAEYNLTHALALLLAALVIDRIGPSTAGTVAGYALLIGVVLFSGSLYALVLSGVRVLGAITPLGGVSLVVGWAALAVAIWSAWDRTP